MSRPPAAARRRYLFALVDGGGSVPPELGTARRLVERGHHVTVLAEDSMTADVASTGATFRRWATAVNRPTRRPEDDPYRDWEVKNPLALFARLMERQFVGPAPAYAADTRAAIEDLAPDLVVCSGFAFGAMIGAEAAGVPFDVLLPNAYVLPAEGIPPFGFGLRPAGGPAGRLRDRMIWALFTRLWNKGLPSINGLRSDLGLGPLESFLDQIHRARRQLVLTSQAFDFPARLPDNVRYVGAVLDDPAWAVDQRWAPPANGRPLVLVGMSSTYQDQVASLQRVIDGLGRLPVSGLVTTGPALDPAALRPPPNVTVVPAAPHALVLEHAAAVVTHGGHGTVIRALAAGVPVLVLPHGRDQADNAARVAIRGAGLRLRATASPRQVAAAVERLLADPAYRRAAQGLGDQIRADASSGALVAELENLPTAR